MLGANFTENDLSDLPNLSPESRLAAISDILATAVLRGKARRGTSSQLDGLEDFSETGGEGLALFRKQSVHGVRQTRPEPKKRKVK